MTRKGKIGSFAAIGGMTAAFVLLIGLPPAQADEISDLKAQMQVLQQRMDQLAQVPTTAPHLTGPGEGGAYGTKAIPGQALEGGSFPRSFLIPGTDTSIRVGGFVDETLDYWLQGGPANGNQTTTVGDNGVALSTPINGKGQIVPGYGPGGFHVNNSTAHSRGNGIFSQSPRESRLNVETRTPTAYGEARTFVEFDFAGTNSFSGNQLTSVSDNLIPRLRYAYGTLGGFLAGQANSNFSDADANPETLDFGGDVGQAGVVRIPQVRYTYAGPYGSAWSVSLETPQTDVLTPGGKLTSDTNIGQNPVSLATPDNVACVANGVTVIGTTACSVGNNNIAMSHAPDLTFASYWSQPWGHVDFRAVLRDLTINDGRFVDRNYLGYGGGISGNVKPLWFGWNKDNFVWQFTVGNGIGRYLNESDDAGLATNYTILPTCVTGCTNSADNVLVHTIFEAGASAGYQHWWMPNLRSNLTFGISHESIPSNLIGPIESTVANRQVITAHANLIWSPVAFIDTGIEYMFGQRMVVAGMRGQEQAIIGKFRVKF